MFKRAIRRFFSEVHVNRVIQFLTLSDIFILSGWGFINPILALYITESIEGATAQTVGIATTIFFLVKSLLQLPIARLIDSYKGEKDDYYAMIAGSLIQTATAILFIYISEEWHLYLLQVVLGIGSALSYPSWMAIFTRHVDRDQEGFEWSIYYTLTDIGIALTALIGGTLAASYSFVHIFVLVSVLNLLGTLLLPKIASNLR